MYETVVAAGMLGLGLAMVGCQAGPAGDSASGATLPGTSTTAADTEPDVTSDGPEQPQTSTSTGAVSTTTTAGASTGASGSTGSTESMHDLGNGADEPLTLWMRVDGDDAASGLSEAEAVATLERVQELLFELQPQTDVEVRIGAGTYANVSVDWQWYDPDHTTTFLPADDEYGGADDIEARPVFDGNGASVFFEFRVSNGEPTNLVFRYLEIIEYQNFGILLAGDRNDPDAGWNGSNTVFGCVFRDIGNFGLNDEGGYAAIDLVNSNDNLIRNNHFLDLRNTPATAGRLHGVYLAHTSRRNRVEANRFDVVSGDPIRVRDGSDENVIVENTFELTGTYFYSDWFCDHANNPNCTKPTPECPSWENEFRDNVLRCGYNGGSGSVFTYYQGETYLPPSCPDGFARGLARLYTSGNTNECN